MGVRILQGDQPYDGAVLYCSTSMWAFGPVFEDAQQAQDFCDWLGVHVDPRTLSEKELENQYHDFLDEREEQKAAEEQEQAAEES